MPLVYLLYKATTIGTFHNLFVLCLDGRFIRLARVKYGEFFFKKKLKKLPGAREAFLVAEQAWTPCPAPGWREWRR